MADGKHWHRSGSLLYTLKPKEGRPRKGWPTHVNEHYFRVEGPDAETMALRIQELLNNSEIGAELDESWPYE